MVSQHNWPAVIKRVRRGLQLVIILVGMLMLYINYGWFSQLFSNIIAGN